MKINLLLAALFLSIGAYAQSTPVSPTQPEVHRHFQNKSPEERAEIRAERKAKLKSMTPTERKTLRTDLKRRQEERLARMTPEQRQKFLDRQRQRKEARKPHQG